ncbi:MAG: HTTM domain-containing protein, partial [Flavobacteriales bacterium]|nr:HTTM domain-containing protein [Flavobacteriales bacterium]
GTSFALFFYDSEKIRSIFFKAKSAFKGEGVHVHQRVKKATTIAFVVFLSIQILLPIRHWYFNGDVNWTEEGHRLSWRMMLRSKGGYVNLYIEDRETGERTSVELDDYLTAKQKRVMATRPDVLWYFVQHLKKEQLKEGKDYAIHADGLVSLNGSLAKALYDPTTDLSKVNWNRFSENDWVVRD